MTNKVFHALQISHFEFDRIGWPTHTRLKRCFAFQTYFIVLIFVFHDILRAFKNYFCQQQQHTQTHTYTKQNKEECTNMAGTHLFRIIVLLCLYLFALQKLFISLVDIRFEYFALFDVLQIANRLKNLGTNIHCVPSLYPVLILCSFRNENQNESNSKLKTEPKRGENNAKFETH